MKDIVSGIFSFSCNECGHRHDIPDEQAEFHRLDGDEEAEDPEHKYGWHESIKCVCGKPIEIDYVVWEYPKGEYANAEIDIEGGTLIDEFTYHLDEAPDEDAYDDDEGAMEW
jgi:hypothetical protein